VTFFAGKSGSELLKHPAHHAQFVGPLLQQCADDAALVEAVYDNPAGCIGGVNDGWFVQKKAHVVYLVFSFFEESQVAATRVYQKVYHLALSGLLRRIAHQFEIAEFEHHLGES